MSSKTSVHLTDGKNREHQTITLCRRLTFKKESYGPHGKPGTKLRRGTTQAAFVTCSHCREMMKAWYR